jgi:hypothetical protein
VHRIHNTAALKGPGRAAVRTVGVGEVGLGFLEAPGACVGLPPPPSVTPAMLGG